jgi:hypothetical protein
VGHVSGKSSEGGGRGRGKSEQVLWCFRRRGSRTDLAVGKDMMYLMLSGLGNRFEL